MQVLLLFASLGVCMAWGFERAFDIIPCIILLIFLFMGVVNSAVGSLFDLQS